MDDFHITSPNDETTWIRPVSASTETWWQKNNMSKFVVDNNASVTVVIKHEGDSIIKKEEIHCSDTKHGLTQDQEIERLKKLIELEKARKPGYWELFAEFYYSDENAPLYCRKYAKPKSIFKIPGTVCLDPTGKWKGIN